MAVFSAGFELFSRSRSAAQKAVRDTRMIERSMVDANKRVAKSMAMIGTAAAAVGASVVHIGKQMSDAATDFDHKIRRVASLSAGAGFDSGLVDQLKEWQDAIQDISLTDDDDVIEGMYQLRSAGLDLNRVLGIGKNVAKAARAEYVSFASAVNLGTTGAKAFNLGLEATDDVLDIFSTAVTLGKTTLDELSQSMFQVAPPAVAAKVPIEQTTAALVALTNVGVPMKQATTWLGQAFIELTKQGTIANSNFQEIAGVTFPEFMEQGGTLGEALGMIQGHLDKTGGTALDFFSSVEGGKAILNLLTEDSKEYNRVVGQMSGELTAVADKLEVVNAGLDAQQRLIEDMLNDQWKRFGDEMAKLELRAIGLAGSLGLVDNEVERSSETLRAMATQVRDGDGDFALHLETLRAYGIEVSRNFETNREFRQEIARQLEVVAAQQDAEEKAAEAMREMSDQTRQLHENAGHLNDDLPNTSALIDDVASSADRASVQLERMSLAAAAAAGSQAFALSMDAVTGGPGFYNSAFQRFKLTLQQMEETRRSGRVGGSSGGGASDREPRVQLTPQQQALAGLSGDITSATNLQHFMPAFIAHFGELDGELLSTVEALAEAGVSFADLDESQMQYLESLHDASEQAKKDAAKTKKAADDKAAADKAAALAAAELERASRAAASMLGSLAGVSAGFEFDPVTGAVTGRQSAADAAIAGTEGTINEFLSRYGVGASGGRRALGNLSVGGDGRITSGPFAGLTVSEATALVDEVEEAYSVRSFQIGERDEQNRIAAGTAGYAAEDHAFALADIGGTADLQARQAQLQQRLEFARTTASKEDDRAIELALARLGDRIARELAANRPEIKLNDEDLPNVGDILDGIDALRLGRGVGRCG